MNPHGAFNPFGALWQVLTQPVMAMSRVADARPWLFGLSLIIVVRVLNRLLRYFLPVVPSGVLSSPAAQLPPQFSELMTKLQAPGIWGPVAIIGGPLTLLLAATAFYAVGRWLGGRGTYAGLLASLGYAEVPTLLLVPLTVLLRLAGPLGTGLLATLSFGFGIWTLVLQVIGIRESLKLSTAQAAATYLIPIALLIVLSCGVGLLVVVWLFKNIGLPPPRLPDGLPPL
ncbi:MAG: hypothetical protein NVS2B7_13010 [Herpetosiphon sp.]